MTYYDGAGNRSDTNKSANLFTVKYPVIEISKVYVEGDKQPGDLVHYNISIINKGLGFANVTINDTFDSSLEIINWTNGSCSSVPSNPEQVSNSSSGNFYQWNLTKLPGKQNALTQDVCWNIYITAKVKSDDFYYNKTRIDNNTVNVSWTDNNGTTRTTTNTSAGIDILTANVTINKTSTPERVNVSPGDNVIYIIEVKNRGNGTAYNIQINDTLPEGLKNIT
ncbi:MAG: hypothetical protein CVT89_08715, partial [Candidatus Altiarchaeales archaeon HGW-Altiarchaeales-2]